MKLFIKLIAFVSLFLVYLAIHQTVALGCGYVLSGGKINPLTYSFVGRVVYLMYSLAAVHSAFEGANEVVFES